jgi:hypothetical protein
VPVSVATAETDWQTGPLPLLTEIAALNERRHGGVSYDAAWREIKNNNPELFAT